MKVLKFSSDSWHYRYMRKIGFSPDPDFCSYTRNFVGATLGYMLLLLIILGALYCIGDFLGWAAHMIVSWQTSQPGFGAIMTTITLAASLLFLAILEFDKWNAARKQKALNAKYWAKKDPNYKEPEPSLVKTWYSSVKDKTCFKIEIQ